MTLCALLRAVRESDSALYAVSYQVVVFWAYDSCVFVAVAFGYNMLVLCLLQSFDKYDKCSAGDCSRPKLAGLF